MLCPDCGSPVLSGHRHCTECGRPLTAVAAGQPLAPGSAIGKYTVLECSDGTGSHRCTARGAGGNLVWIKEGEPEDLDAEAAALAAVSHPAVARPVERVSAGGRAYLVTAAPAAAIPLHQAGNLDAGQVLDLALQLCDVASAWHASGYVYGDFSPWSVYYEPASGRVWLPGAARAVPIEAADAGPAADVFGVAFTLYRVLAREAQPTPSRAGPGPLWPPLHAVRPDLPPDLCSVLDQALSGQAAGQFITPAAMAGALLAISAPLRLEPGACTDRGSVRLQNQDCVYAAVIGLAGGDRGRATGGVFVCCDGMGGEVGGEIAAGLTVEAVGGAMTAFLGTRLARQPAPDGAELGSALRQAVSRANQLLRERVRETPALHGMGTTATAAAICGSTGVIVHVGDSRCYLWEPGGSIRQVTRDQSLVEQMVAAGQITADQARRRPDRNLLWQAVGTRDLLEPEVIQLTLQSGQKLVLVSDGVHGSVTDAELAELLSRPLAAQAAANLLVHTAIARGSDDNCTAVVVGLHYRA